MKLIIECKRERSPITQDFIRAVTQCDIRRYATVATIREYHDTLINDSALVGFCGRTEVTAHERAMLTSEIGMLCERFASNDVVRTDE